MCVLVKPTTRSVDVKKKSNLGHLGKTVSIKQWVMEESHWICSIQSNIVYL